MIRALCFDCTCSNIWIVPACSSSSSSWSFTLASMSRSCFLTWVTEIIHYIHDNTLFYEIVSLYLQLTACIANRSFRTKSFITKVRSQAQRRTMKEKKRGGPWPGMPHPWIPGSWGPAARPPAGPASGWLHTPPGPCPAGTVRRFQSERGTGTGARTDTCTCVEGKLSNYLLCSAGGYNVYKHTHTHTQKYFHNLGS